MSTTSCPVCQQNFDVSVRVPHVVPCGHSICEICLTDLKSNKFMQCAICATGYPVGFFPVNYGLKDQLDASTSQLTEKESSDECYETAVPWNSSGWHCAECSFPLPPCQARLCVRCVETEIAENTVKGLTIHSYEECESRLVCAHCVMESKHRFHITKLYLPIKLEQSASERCEELCEKIRKLSANRDEEATAIQTVVSLRDLTVQCTSWSEFEQHWQQANEFVSGVNRLNRKIAAEMTAVEDALKRIGDCQETKKTLFARLEKMLAPSRTSSPLPPVPTRNATRKTMTGSKRKENSARSSKPARPLRRTNSFRDSDSDSGCSSTSSLRRFGAVVDLTRVGTDDEEEHSTANCD